MIKKLETYFNDYKTLIVILCTFANGHNYHCNHDKNNFTAILL